MLRTVLLTLTILLHVNNSSGYFSYDDDCGQDCINDSKQCTITEYNETTFTIQCTTPDLCREAANEAVPCISEDAPTRGGQDLWAVYKDHRVRPRPSPKDRTVSSTWFTIAMIQASALIIIIITLSVMKVRKYRARLEFDRLPILNPENPYEPCVENIPPEE